MKLLSLKETKVGGTSDEIRDASPLLSTGEIHEHTGMSSIKDHKDDSGISASITQEETELQFCNLENGWRELIIACNHFTGIMK